MDRLTNLRYDGSSYAAYGYDRTGNRTSMTDGTGTTTYGYDGLNRLTSVTAGGQTVTYDYDDAGHVTGLGYPGGHEVGYAYDDAGRLQEMSDDGQVIAHYAYDDSSRLAAGTIGPGATGAISFTYGYYEAGEPHALTYSGPGSFRFEYTIDDVGNRLSEAASGGVQNPRLVPLFWAYLPFVVKGYDDGITPSDDGSGGDVEDFAARASLVHRTFTPFTRTIAYTYTNLYQLAQATSTNDVTYTFQYGYDPAGNRTTSHGPGGNRSYSYDDADRLTQVSGQAYTWDDNGNLVSDGARTFTYDAANRLTRVVSGTLTIDYVYNGDLLEQTVDGVTTQYTLDPLGLTDIMEARQGDDVTTYFHGLGPLGEESASGERTYYGLDALGSVRFLVNGHRQVMGQYTYSPFGEPYQENGPTPLYGYAGEPWNADAGLTYLRARHYDPALGRFLTRDSFPGFSQMPQTLHPYVYAGNNPVNLTDLSGYMAPIDPRKAPKGIVVLGTDPATAGTSAAISAASATYAALAADGDSTNELRGLAEGIAADVSQMPQVCTRIKTGTYSIYQLVQNDTVVYIGRTNNFARRLLEHMRLGGWRIELFPGLEALSKFDVRSAEQALLEHYGLSKYGGQLLNKVMGVARNNPMYPTAIQRGNELLHLIGVK